MLRRHLLLIGYLTMIWGVTPGLADLVAQWPLDGDYLDASGNGHNGTPIGDPEMVNDNERGLVLEVDGGDRVMIEDAPDLNFSDNESLTMTAWALYDPVLAPGGWQTAVAKGRTGTGGDTGYLDTLYGIYVSGSGSWHANAGSLQADAVPVVPGEWQHLAFVQNADKGQDLFYVDLEEVLSGGTADCDTTGRPFFIGAAGTDTGSVFEAFGGRISDVRIYNEALEGDALAETTRPLTPPVLAANPSPASGATDVSWDGPLSWSSGIFAAQHNVFLGTVWEDVNNASSAEPRGVLVMAGLDTNAFDPDRLMLDTTYYWRVDEVNAPPDSTVFKGDVWNFTVEPVSYAIAANTVAVRASSAVPGQGAINTINSSGLNENDEHDSNQDTMWLSDPADTAPWIQFEFDALQKLDKAHVWNHNTQTEGVLGFGIKEALIEYSSDGENWIEMGSVEVAQATGLGDYHGVDMDLGGITARHIRMTAKTNWSILGLPQKGLSEIRFYAIPMVARLENPASGSVDVAPRADLSWRPGREAVEHAVFIGTDPDALIQVALVDDPGYTVSADLGTTVYWQINEINDAMIPAAWEGPLWSFDTAPYVTVDDMEDYKSQDGEWIWETWTDGFGDDNNGALLGHGGDNMETGIVYDGSQSLPYFYGQSGAGTSEASRDIEGDWSKHGIVSLSLMFHGQTSNVPGQMYLKVNDEKIATYPASADLNLPQWQAWTLDLPASALAPVRSLAIGFEGGSGLVYIDAIRLYPKASQMITPTEPDNASLVAHYPLNNSTQDLSGNERHGMATGDPIYVAGPAGLDSGLLFDGTDSQYVDLGTWNPSAVTHELTLSLWTRWTGWSGQWQGLIGKRDSWAAAEMMWHLEAHIDTGTLRFGQEGLPQIGDNLALIEQGEWEPWAVTCDGTTATVYRHGKPVASGDFLFGTKTNASMQFGCGQTQGANPYNGALSEIRLYEQALSPAEIASLAGRTDPYTLPME